jgi:hypothetical protein
MSLIGKRANSAIHGSAVTASPVFTNVAIGGGGYVTGIQIAADGRKACRVDVYDAYVRGPSDTQWRGVITEAGFPPSLGGISGTRNMLNNGDLGVWEISIAPSNTNIVYMLIAGAMLVSFDFAVTWTLMTGFPAISWSTDANGSLARISQKKIAVDPINPDVVYIGTPANGMYVTYNGTSGASATFSSVSSVPAGTSRNGINGIAFYPTSGSTGGKTNTIYAASYGNGVYSSTNAGSTWALAASGGPINVTDGIVSGGLYYCAAAGAYQLSAGTWYSLAGGIINISINPFDGTWIAGMGNGGGNFNQGTLNISGHSVSWVGPYWNSGGNPNVPPSDIGWLADTRPGYPTFPVNNWASSAVAFDPITANRIWLSWGYGVSIYDIPSKTLSAGTEMAWPTISLGTEALVGRDIISEPGYYPVVSVDDQNVFQIIDPTIGRHPDMVQVQEEH